ncbi:hypothetical protein [Gloeocapsopsis dulcis]|uniref:hypothetical protein n=1 Tax=Gloeocapsopsis dulcis TaxID=2859516 RepID=UPI00137A808A|nr:hypothetical protein [Gloeocapsopsis dulcis]
MQLSNSQSYEPIEIVTPSPSASKRLIAIFRYYKQAIALSARYAIALGIWVMVQAI